MSRPAARSRFVCEIRAEPGDAFFVSMTPDDGSRPFDLLRAADVMLDCFVETPCCDDCRKAALEVQRTLLRLFPFRKIAEAAEWERLQ